MPDAIQTTDKTELTAFLQALSEAVLAAVDKVESAHPDWQATNLTVTARGVIKPATINGKSGLVLDIDEPANEPVSEIVIPLARVARTTNSHA